MLKNMRIEKEEMLLEVCQKAWKSGKVPNDWLVSVIVTLFKKGDMLDYQSYRRISLQSVVGKIYEHVLKQLLGSEIEPELRHYKVGIEKAAVYKTT